jgi:hypothetical protein
MNKVRRKELSNIIEGLNLLKGRLDSIANDEQFAFDNLTEGLQQTSRGEAMEENADNMFEALDKLEEVIDTLNDVY